MEQEFDRDRAVPPYVPFRTFENLIDRLAAEGVPARIDRSVLNGLSGSIQSGLLKLLASFELIDESGIPQKRLHSLANSNGHERQEIYREVLDQFYSGLFASFDIEKATQAQLHEWFRTFSISGSTVDKAASFFLDLSAKSGIKLSPHFKKTAGGVRRQSGRRNSTAKSALASRGLSSGSQKSVEDLAILALPILREKLILGLIERLPDPEEDFTEEQRTFWLEYAKMTFAMVYGSSRNESSEKKDVLLF